VSQKTVFGTQHYEDIDVNDCSYAHLTLILLLYYLVKRRSRSVAVYNNEFILGSAYVGSENQYELNGQTTTSAFNKVV